MNGCIMIDPIFPVSELTLTKQDKESYQKELFAPYQERDDDYRWPQTFVCEPGSFAFVSNRFNMSDISASYEFSNYIVDPNGHYFSMVINIVAFVKRFVRYCRLKVQLSKFQLSKVQLPRVQKSKIQLSSVQLSSCRLFKLISF